MAASSSESRRTETIARGPVPWRTFTAWALGRSTGFPLSISIIRRVRWPHAGVRRAGLAASNDILFANAKSFVAFPGFWATRSEVQAET
jgi:hypothetical protein